jgi:hypothetical protein
MVKHIPTGTSLSSTDWESPNTHIVSDIPDGYLLGSNGNDIIGVDPATLRPSRFSTIQFVFGNGVDDIVNTDPDQWLEAENTCSIISARLTADVIGDFQVDIWKMPFANFPGTSADTITGGSSPALNGTISSEADISSWIINITRGDWIRVHIENALTVKRVVLSIGVSIA